MPKGGDRRPIHKSKGRELIYASHLMQALTEDTSESGLAFNQDRLRLFRRWERLVRVLMRNPPRGSGRLPSELDAIGDYLQVATLGRSVVYPKPRPLTPEEETRLICRQNAASEAFDDLYPELMPHESGQDEETQVWGEVTNFLNQWTDEVFWTANPGRKRRISTHPMVKKYPKEVASFCKNWRLDAWWAVPAIIQSLADFDKADSADRSNRPGLQKLLELRAIPQSCAVSRVLSFTPPQA